MSLSFQLSRQWESYKVAYLSEFRDFLLCHFFYLIVVHICIESFFAKSVKALKVAFMSNIHC